MINALSSPVRMRGTADEKAYPEIPAEPPQDIKSIEHALRIFGREAGKSYEEMGTDTPISDRFKSLNQKCDNFFYPFLNALTTEFSQSPYANWLGRCTHQLKNVISFANLPAFRYVLAQQQNPNLPFEEVLKATKENLLQICATVTEELAYLKEDLNTKTQPVGSLADKAVQSTLPFIEGKQQKLTVTMQPDVDWDRLQADLPDFTLFDVFSNLIQNAAKYTPEQGNIQVNLRLADRADTQHLVFEVTDSGIGIPQAEIAKVTTGYRASNAVSSGIHGTGKGLAQIATDVGVDNLRIESPVSADPQHPGTRVTCIIPVASKATNGQ